MDSRSGAWARLVRFEDIKELRLGQRLLHALPALVLLAAISFPLSSGVAQAAAEEQVREAQRLLKQLALLDPRRYGDLDPGEIDGAIGPTTREAIRQFRVREGLPAGGLDDSLHRALLAARVGLALEDSPSGGATRLSGDQDAPHEKLYATELDPPNSTDLAAAIFLSGPIAKTSAPLRTGESLLSSAAQAAEPLKNHNLAVSLSIAVATTLSLVLFLVGQRRKARLLAGWRGGRSPRAARTPRASARQSETERNLRQAFATLPLQHAREIRDGLLEELSRSAESKGGSLAMLVSTSMKRLMRDDRESYKRVFSNLLFLDRVGRELRAGRITLERLDSALMREIDLARGAFRLHLLELAEHDRLRERLPGLWLLLGEGDSEDLDRG